MPTKVYWIHTFINSAKIGIMPRPRGGDWLEEEIDHLKKDNAGLVVSLLEQEEIRELELDCEEEICASKNISFINFSITDRDVPKQNDNADVLIDGLVNKIKEGVSVVIHCRMGIGRSSIIAAAVLLKFNFKAADIIKNISAVRGLKVPDTEEQLLWLNKRKEIPN